MHSGIELKCLLVRHRLTQYKLASKLGLCPTTLNRQLNGQAPLSKSEIEKIRKMIQLLRREASSMVKQGETKGAAL